jgi:CRISPR-associated exonuclease Cas4
MYSDEDLLLISGLQHVAFCEKQWALIHMEQEWEENPLTIDGKHLHEFVHEQNRESRGTIRTVTSMRLRSLNLGLYGIADMVEFHRDSSGVEIKNIANNGERWIPYPVEYKRGRKRYDLADEIQLCAQALCLEEMLEVRISQGAIYYGQPRRRVVINFSIEIKNEVYRLCSKARRLFEGVCAPQYNTGAHCKNCSLFNVCMPNLTLTDKSAIYVKNALKDILSPRGDTVP